LVRNNRGKWLLTEAGKEEARRARIVRGEISEEEGRRIILRGRGSNQYTGGGSKNDDVTTSIGRGRAYTLARLDRASAEDLSLKGMTAEQFAAFASQVRAKKISANAAATQAGFRKKPKRKKLTRIERSQRQIQKLSRNECEELLEWLKDYYRSFAKTGTLI
jgi:hypothetical protein